VPRDLIAFNVTAIAGAVILTTGFRHADGIASLVVAAVMLRAAYQLLKASGRVFLEAAPPGVDPDAIGRAPASRSSTPPCKSTMKAASCSTSSCPSTAAN